MKIIHLAYPLSIPAHELPEAPQVLAIGDFDGIHLGHQEVLSRALATARSLRLPASIMTFHPHPREILGHAGYQRVLTPMSCKLQKFSELGIDCTYIVAFNEQLMKLPPQLFIESMLVPMKPNTAVVGFDFTFGHLGAGTPDTLTEVSGGRFTVEVVRPYNLDGEKVSSTLIREKLHLGDMLKAGELLGRPYAINGKVVTGDGRGRTIGFPTANIALTEPFFVPRGGVYAIRVVVRGIVYDGVMNIGVKPTFAAGNAGPAPSLEAHLFHFNGDIYGEEIQVQFIDFLREERKFAGVEQLVEQIERDVIQAKAILGE